MSSLNTATRSSDIVRYNMSNIVRIKLFVLSSGIRHDTRHVVHEEPGSNPSLSFTQQDAQPYNIAIQIVDL